MDASEIGRFGTLSLLRRLPTESVVTSYPIDDEELTIGRDQSCSLRLYYPAVSALHAKITFIDRKAFLVILGTNGVLLDDEPLFPAAATATGSITVPLQNNSVIEIHKKRFRFSYPPKHLRTALINTPTRATPEGTRRPLRLSMIASAHVFTPRPSRDPQENLRILQTPLRTPFAREQEEIVLVHSDTPRVVEEDSDLVILDEVEPEPEPVLPLPLPVMPQYPSTPVRRPRPSLHRAVLIRSAQRAIIQREIQREEEQEEVEVEETIAAIAEVEENDEDVQEVPPSEGQKEVSGWRKSLDMVKGSFGWAFHGLSVEPKEEDEEPVLDDDGLQGYPDADELDEDMEDEATYENNDQNDQENDIVYEDEQPDVESSEQLRPLGQFMSPQIHKISQQQPRLSLGGARLSLSGALGIPDAGPRRVRVVTPWKVHEIQVPTAVKEEASSAPSTSIAAPPSTPRSPVKREKLTDEEREAIRARRRSALATPDNFFKGQTPGSRRTLFPSLAPLPSPSFTQPSEPVPSSSQSTMVAQDAPTATTSSSAPSTSGKVEEEEDTAVLLARMKQMVEGVKQRQSLGRQSFSLSPRKRDSGFSLLAPNHASTHRASRLLIEEDEGDVHMQGGDDDQEEPEPDVPAQSVPKTPRMSDLRHALGRPHDEPSTPVLVGVRDMFRAQPQGSVETPRTDGVKEMLDIPAGDRVSLGGGNHGEDKDEDIVEQEVEHKPVEELPVRGAGGKKTPATRIARRTPIPQSAPPKSTRAASQAFEESRSADAIVEDEGHAGRRTRARTADGAIGQISRATRGKAAKPATPEPKEDEDEPEPRPAAAPARAGRRTRQTTDSSATSHTDETTAESKPARRTRAKTPTTTAKTGTSRRGTRAKPIEVAEDDNDNDDDPLDSLPRERVHTAEAPAARGRRGGRSKIPVKEEDVEESVPPASEAVEQASGARTTRSRRTPVPKVPPSTTATGTAGRSGTRSRTATVSGGVEAAIPEGKENTPEPNAEDDREDTGDETRSTGTKTRGASKGTRGKATGKGSAAANSDAGEEPAAVPAVGGTRTRAGRARVARA